MLLEARLPLTHPDRSGIASVDWAAIIRNLPARAQAEYDRARKARKEKLTRDLTAYDKGLAVGLTEYDPDADDRIGIETRLLVQIGELVEQAHQYASERELGVVQASRDVKSAPDAVVSETLRG